MKDYMERDEEVKKQPDALPSFERVAKDAPLLGLALRNFWNFSHVWDDLIDESGWGAEKKEQAWKALDGFVTDLLMNPLYKQNASEMRAMFTSAIHRQVAGDALELRGEKTEAAVCRCADIDILVMMAMLTKGWDAASEVSKLRDYDKPDGEAKTVIGGLGMYSGGVA